MALRYYYILIDVTLLSNLPTDLKYGRSQTYHATQASIRNLKLPSLIIWLNVVTKKVSSSQFDLKWTIFIHISTKVQYNVHCHSYIGESKQERLCLSVLKDLDRIPEIGFKLVPEHVETRSLYRSDRPGVEQVHLQWMISYELNGRVIF